MERHRCKLCHRRFANGRALGGHMRSHMMSLPIPPKPSYETESLLESTSSSSSSSSDSEEDIEEEEDDDVRMIEEGVLYKSRENPRKSIKLADLEDRESETESTRNQTRRRSKRRRKPPPTTTTTPSFNDKDFADINEVAEPVSSISEVTSEEDVAFCLMMLSRDKWTSCHGRTDYGDIIIRDDVTNSYNTTTITKSNNDGIYRCETCNKVFRSYQALGGHRASHKKIWPVAANIESHTLYNNHNNNNNDNNERQPKKTHECPVCLRVFASGQALGGHKRSHANDNHQLSDQSPKKIKVSGNSTLIDLNLPAPLDDDDDHDEISQFTVSAVSDAHL